jgi:putative inorganic carbon (HCO3(-)) transporter
MIGPDVQIGHAHNLFLQVGIDLGLPGLIAFLALLINTFTLLARALQRREAALDWALAAGSAGGLTAMLVNGIFDAPVWGTRPAFVPWLLVALSVQIGLRTAAHIQEIPERASSPSSANSA